MKKLFIPVAAIAVLAIVSCNSSSTTAKSTDSAGTTTTTVETGKKGDSTTTTVTATTTSATDIDGIAVPEFKDAEVNKWMQDYASFLSEYKNGLKDPAKLQALSAKMQDFAAKTQSITTKLAADQGEMKKYTDFMTALAPKMQAWATGK